MNKAKQITPSAKTKLVEIGKQIHYEIIKKGISYVEIQKQTGLSWATIKSIINGEKSFTANVILVCECVGIEFVIGKSE